MKPPVRNIISFTIFLFVLTFLLEWYRKGEIRFEQPALFITALVVLGIIGGYVFTWAYENKNR
jgi:hypothetical protein